MCLESASAMALHKLAETVSRSLADDIYRCSLTKQTGVSLKYMMDFGSHPNDNNMLFSAQFLHKELPVRLAHRVTELENLPHGLSSKADVLKAKTGKQRELWWLHCWGSSGGLMKFQGM